MKRLLSGNEAIARGAYEYGVKVACGYPGTPSTEILETISQHEEIYSSEHEVKGYYEVSVVVSPKSQCRMRIRSSTVGGAISEAFAPIGESIAKRQLLIRETY